MQLNEVMKKKRVGDLQTAAEIVGIRPDYASQILNRKTFRNSKKYFQLIIALAIIIQEREQLVERLTTDPGEQYYKSCVDNYNETGNIVI